MDWEAEELEVAQDSQAQEKVRARKHDSDESRNRLGAFHQRWRSAISDLLPSWLNFEQHEQAHEALNGVIARCSERDEVQMPWILRDAMARLVAPWEKERLMRIRREQVLRQVLWSLTGSATPEEKAKLITAIRKALADLSSTALEYEERSLAEGAVRRANEEVKLRLAEEDKERVEKIAQARKVREEQHLKSKKDDLLRQGVDKVFWCLQRLMNDDEISEEDYEDIDQESLKRAVGRSLQSEITGDESYQDLEALVGEIVREELGIG